MRENNHYINGPCPIHKGDNQNAFVYYKDTGSWMCFTHSCHGAQNSGNMISFISKLKNISEEDSIKLVENIYGLTNSFDQETIDRINFNTASMSVAVKNEKPHKFIDTSMFDNFITKYDYYIDRGYRKETLEHFNVRFCDDTSNKYCNRAIIPIHDKNGNLVSWSARWIGNYKEDNVSKFLHVANFQKSKILYNWHRAEKYFTCGYVFVVESPGAVWGLHQIGVYNAVAVMGKTLSESQAKTLINHPNIHTVILCFDSDEAGREGMSEKNQTIKNLKNKVKIQAMYLNDSVDLDNISKKDFEHSFLKRKKI
jgi:DNA primase